MSAFVDELLDLLAPLGEGVRARKMFGGYGIYKDDLMFGLVAEDRLYLRTDDETRAQFEDRGCEPFVFGYKNGKAIVSKYFEPPEAAFTSPLKMKPWATLAWQTTLRSPVKKKPRRKASKAKKARPRQSSQED